MRRNYIFFTHSLICIKMYLNVMRHVTFYNSFFTQRKQWKWAAEMAYN